MKKKLTVNTLAVGNLRQRKKQYTIMIIGIVLAMVFSSSISLFMASSHESFNEARLQELGTQAAVTYAQDKGSDFYDKAVNDKIINDYGLAHIIGFGYTNDDEENMGAAIGWLDDKAKQIQYQTFIEGSYPVNENEIAVEKTALIKLGIDAKIGDEITLKVKTQNGSEYFDTNTKTYKLTGIVKDKKSNIQSYNGGGGYDEMLPAVYVAQNTQTEAGGKERLTAYVTFSNPENHNTYTDLWTYIQDNTESFEICDASIYTSWYSGSLTTISSNGVYIVIIAAVLAAASCIAIVNSFNTNLKERRKQIGMFRAVGTTRRQIINIFGREAFIISLIATPVSTAVSYLLVKGLISLLNKDAVMTKSIYILLISAVLGFIVTMLSALLPLIRASKITPVQAIRNINNNRRVKTKRIKSEKEFNVPSHLAKRNMIFYKGGNIAVSVMLIATIVFSCFGFSYVQYAKNNTWSLADDYSITSMGTYADEMNFVNYNVHNGMSEVDKQDIAELPYVSEANGEKSAVAMIGIDEMTDYYKAFHSYLWSVWNPDEEYISYETFAENMTSSYSELYTDYKNRFGFDKEMVPVLMNSYETGLIEGLENCVSDGKINTDKLSSGEEVILVAPKKASLALEIYGKGDGSGGYSAYTVYNDNKDAKGDGKIILGGESTYRAGDKIMLKVAEYKDEEERENNPDHYTLTEKEVTVAAIIDPSDLPEDGQFRSQGSISVITTHQGMAVFNKNVKYYNLNINCNQDIDDRLNTAISDTLRTYTDKYNGYLTSNYDMMQSQENDIKSMYVSMLALIIIGFAICASIVNNTLTASIRENKRTLGTLRAVGASERELVQSYVKQLLSMFSWGYIIGFGGYVLIYLILYIVYKFREETFGLSFSPWMTILFAAVLFGICSLNLWSKIRSEMKNSIVENIREL